MRCFTMTVALLAVVLCSDRLLASNDDKALQGTMLRAVNGGESDRAAAISELRSMGPVALERLLSMFSADFGSRRCC